MAIQKPAKNVQSTRLNLETVLHLLTSSWLLNISRDENLVTITMIHISVCLVWTVLALTGANKTDLVEYSLVGENMTELSLASLNTEDEEQEELQEEDLVKDAPIDAGRRKGKT